MADVSVTASSVVAGTGATFDAGIASTTITAGQTLTRETAGTIGLARATTAALADCCGIALHAALSGQPIKFITSGPVTLGSAVMTANMWYFVSGTTGGIRPASDMVSGSYGTVLGYASTTSVLTVSITVSGTALASDIA